MNIVVDANNVVLMYSETASPEPEPGCSLVTLTKEQEQELLALPHERAGMTFDGKKFAAIPLPPPIATRKGISDGKLAELLVERGILTQAQVDEAVINSIT